MEADISRQAEDKDEQCLQGQSDPGGMSLASSIAPITIMQPATGQHGDDRSVVEG